ncbi:MAG: hypothetical protein GX591_10535, partial [Planctomycetes bacterium]|nr:hypothetical protein [Planctomycetota bacterium]
MTARHPEHVRTAGAACLALGALLCLAAVSCTPAGRATTSHAEATMTIRDFTDL